MGLPIAATAQLSDSYPAYFHNFSADKNIENHSLYNHDDKYTVNTNYKSFFGIQSKIKIYNLGGYLLTERNHRLGIRVHSENEGEFVQRNRLNLIYSVNKSLSKDVDVAFSGYFGGLFYGYSSVGNFQGGNDRNIDLGFASSIKHNALTIGLSGNQLNQPTLRPLNYQYDIRRYFDLLAEYKITLSNQWDLYTTAKYRKTHHTDTDITHFHTRVVSNNERYFIGINYLVDLGISPSLGISIPYDEANKQFIQLNFSFFMTANNNVGNPFIDKQYELSISWKLKK